MQIIKNPLSTEKSIRLMESDNTLIFVVGKKATKEAIKNEIGNTSLVIKIAYFEDDKKLSALVGSAGKIVDGIAAINTFPAKILNKEGKAVFSFCSLCI